MLLRVGDRGDAVRDLRSRLAGAGIAVGPGDVFDDACEQALRDFQQRRHLRTDGVCGPETWNALIESGRCLGERLLYLVGDMQRGDDVLELQRRLNALGFDAGREDGIFGTATERGLRQFQRNAAVPADGICGPTTLHALQRVSSLAAGSVATVRERDRLRRGGRRVAELRVFLAVDPALVTLAAPVAQGLRKLGATLAIDTSGADASVLAQEANRYRADVFLALQHGTASTINCAYFENQQFRSEGGYHLAVRLTDALRAVLKNVDEPGGRTYRALRETRMAAVVCELVATDIESTSVVAARLPDIANAIVEGMRRGVEEPPET